LELTHSFTVPASVQDTWSAFCDIEDVAGCFPGAAVTSVEGEEFKGTVKVKLGPIALQYAGSGRFVERDEPAHRFVVEAKGKDKRGNGTASALVTASMSASAADSTSVEVRTDLSITGKPAQFGRGVIQDVSDKLLQQFVDCLADRVGAPGEEDVPTPAAVPGEAPPPDLGTGAPSEPPLRGAEARATGAGGAHAREQDGSSRTGPETPGGGRRRDNRVEALDLGATVLPVLAKAYWKQAAGAAVVLLVLRRLLGRRH
jgi:carbon monoxide dehydrogenase subunit G